MMSLDHVTQEMLSPLAHQVTANSMYGKPIVWCDYADHRYRVIAYDGLEWHEQSIPEEVLEKTESVGATVKEIAARLQHAMQTFGVSADELMAVMTKLAKEMSVPWMWPTGPAMLAVNDEDGGAVSPYTQVASLVPGLRTPWAGVCPTLGGSHCDFGGNYLDWVIHLNDTHEWAWNEIVEWLESVGADLTVVEEKEVTHDGEDG